MSPTLARIRDALPPAPWALSATVLSILCFFIGFFHWMLFAGVMFATLLLRPRREWPAWYVLFCLASLFQYVVIAFRTYGGPVEMYAQQGLALLLIGHLVHPLLAMVAVHRVQHLGLQAHERVTLRDTMLQHFGASLLALLLTLKDFAYIFTEGMVGDVRRGRIVDMQPIVLPDSLPVLVKFGLSHFMGAFVGVMLVVPLALWALLPANRPGSARILRAFWPHAALLPLLVYFGNTRIPGYDGELGGLLILLLLVVVVVFSFRHGWRGAALSVLAVSSLIAYDDHLRGNASDVLELQLTVAILGSMALLFGIGMDELRRNQAALQADKVRLRDVLAELADASRRAMQTEERERKRLAHELHDELGQLLTALELRLAGSAANPDIAGLQQLGQRMRQSLGSVVNTLSPNELNQISLYESLVYGSPSQLCELAGIRYQVELQGNGMLLNELQPATALAAYRVVQEAVNNAVKHARCRRIGVRLRVGRRAGSRHGIVLALDIRDDGVGLDEDTIRAGFHSIRDRALALGGAVRIASPGGLRVHALLRQ